MRRLFSSFAHGAPGAGLLLLRLAVGVTLIGHAVTGLIEGPPFMAATFYSLLTLLGILLLVGLWTPIVGALIALSVISEGLSHSASCQHCASIGIMAVALTLLGPGAWSVDAWLYGWKQIKIPERPRDPDPRA